MTRQRNRTVDQNAAGDGLDSSTFSLRDICERYGTHAEYVIEMVSFGIVEPQTGRDPLDWRFSCAAFLRFGKAIRLQSDLSLNLPGIAMSLELLDELQSLRREVADLRQHLQHFYEED